MEDTEEYGIIECSEEELLEKIFDLLLETLSEKSSLPIDLPFGFDKAKGMALIIDEYVLICMNPPEPEKAIAIIEEAYNTLFELSGIREKVASIQKEMKTENTGVINLQIEILH